MPSRCMWRSSAPCAGGSAPRPEPVRSLLLLLARPGRAAQADGVALEGVGHAVADVPRRLLHRPLQEQSALEAVLAEDGQDPPAQGGAVLESHLPRPGQAL